jgi:hypothetical protein
MRHPQLTKRMFSKLVHRFFQSFKYLKIRSSASQQDDQLQKDLEFAQNLMNEGNPPDAKPMDTEQLKQVFLPHHLISNTSSKSTCYSLSNFKSKST